jgi:hypothetical protein
MTPKFLEDVWSLEDLPHKMSVTRSTLANEVFRHTRRLSATRPRSASGLPEILSECRERGRRPMVTRAHGHSVLPVLHSKSAETVVEFPHGEAFDDPGFARSVVTALIGSQDASDRPSSVCARLDLLRGRCV